MNSVFAQVALVFVFNLVGYACNVAANAILTNNLPLHLYGDFACAWRSLGLISQLVIFGTTLSANTFMARYAMASDEEKQRGFMIWNFRLVFKLFMILFLLYLSFWGVALVTHTHEQFSGSYHLSAFVAIFGPVLALTAIIRNYILAKGYPTLASFSGSVIWYGVKLGVVAFGFIVFVPTTDLHLSYLVVVTLFVLLVVNALAYSLLPENELYDSLKDSLSLRKENRKKPYFRKEWYDVSKGAVVGNLFATISATAGIYLVEIFSPSEHNVALFNICLVSVGFVWLLLDSMNALYRARVAAISSLSKQQLASLQHALDAIGIVRLTLTATSMYLYYLFSGDIFAFFNVSDTQHAILLPLMLLSTYFENSAGLRVTYLMSHNQQAYCIITQLIRMVSMIGLGIYLVITYDIYGVVIANFISRLIKLVLLTYKCRQKTSIRFNRFF